MFAAILKKARETQGLIDLGQGYPDFAGSSIARQNAASTILNDIPHNQYSQPPGLLRLRLAVCQHHARRGGHRYCESTEVVVTASG